MQSPASVQFREADPLDLSRNALLTGYQRPGRIGVDDDIGQVAVGQQRADRVQLRRPAGHHHRAQRWFYAPETTPDEVLLIKGWDSIDDGRARFTRAAPSRSRTAPTQPRARVSTSALTS